MAYVPDIWAENMPNDAGGIAIKVANLNHLETQYAEGVTYIANFFHDAYYYLQADALAKFYRTPAEPTLGRNDGPDSLLNAGTVDGYTKAQLQAMAIPSQVIALWGLPIASLNAAVWQLCNGESGSPNMEGKLLLGAGANPSGLINGGNVAPGGYGGSATKTPADVYFNAGAYALTENQIPRHRHEYWDKITLGNTGANGNSGDPMNTGVYAPVLVYTRTIDAYPNMVTPGGSVALPSTTHDHTCYTHTTAAMSLLPASRAVPFILKR